MKCLVWLLASFAWAPAIAVSSRTYDINGRPVRASGPSNRMDRGRRSREMQRPDCSCRDRGRTRGQRFGADQSHRADRQPLRPQRSSRATGTRAHRRDQRTRRHVRSLSTVSRGDINGSFQLAERSTKVTRTVGNRVESTTAIERPTLNGSMDLVEKNEQTIVASGAKTTENVTVFRRDPNGRMAEFAKKTREAVSQRRSGSRECRGV